VIVDSPLLLDLGLGVDRVIPEADDARVQIPSTLNPVIVPLIAHDINTLVGATLRGSAILNMLFAKVNQAGADDAIVILPKGLWTIHWEIDVATNFTQPVAQSQGFCRLSLNYQGQTIALVPIHVRAALLNHLSGTMRLLLKANATLQFSYNLTGVGENLDVSVALQIEKAY
jgi:hypothetical protein